VLAVELAFRKQTTCHLKTMKVNRSQAISPILDLGRRQMCRKPGKSRISKKDKVKTLMKKDVEWVCSELKEMDVDQLKPKLLRSLLQRLSKEHGISAQF